MIGATDYTESIEWLEALYRRPQRSTSEVGLDRALFLLEQLGNPHCAFNAVHVTGSSGKGSTTTMIGSMVQATGVRTGYFRSPHLESYRERIAIGDDIIDEASWLACFRRVSSVANAMESGAFNGYDLGRPSLFEVLFAIMATYFRDEEIQWAAVETGMGGRLDATNTLRAAVAVITNVALEHTQILGNTIEAIAGEKAAIIKEGKSCVTAATDPAALRVIERRATEQRAELRRVGRDICWEIERRDLQGQHVLLEAGGRHVHAELGVLGDFQAVNAATAFGAAICLRKAGLEVDDAAIALGLRRARIPGRFEMVSRDPLIVLDGAHNPGGMVALGQAVDAFLRGRRLVLLFASMADKDFAGMAREFGARADVVITTAAPNTDRGAPSERLGEAFAGLTRKIIPIEQPADALSLALDCVGRDDAVLVAGSLYLVGWTRTELRRRGGRHEGE